MREELRRRGWKEEDLPGRRKGDKVKVALARRWRQETTMTLGCIAKRLNMGAAGSVANLLRCERRKQKYAIMRATPFFSFSVAYGEPTR